MRKAAEKMVTTESNRLNFRLRLEIEILFFILSVLIGALMLGFYADPFEQIDKAIGSFSRMMHDRKLVFGNNRKG